MEKLSSAYIAIGSNMGSRMENLKTALHALETSENITVSDISGFYKTQPVDFVHQAWFVNAVVKVETRLSPSGLLAALNSVEKRMGQKTKTVRYGPRIIDLDIIYYDDVVISSEKLQIPHPRMHKRCFVLIPLCDIGRDKVHPVYQKNTEALLQSLDDTDDQEVIPIEKET